MKHWSGALIFDMIDRMYILQRCKWNVFCTSRTEKVATI